MLSHNGSKELIQWSHVFLSYARADHKRAKRLADALTSAGHSVWWDFQIGAGDRFGDAIDSALKDADAVIVLSSHASIETSWVRDEAAAGRDTGRLVPILIEPVEPPLGFRQYQCSCLAGWSGRGQCRNTVERWSLGTLCRNVILRPTLQIDRYCKPPAGTVPGLDGTAVKLDDPAYDREPKPCARAFASEWFENAWQLVWINTWATVPHLESCEFGFGRRDHIDGMRGVIEANSVAEDIFERAP